MRNLTLTLLLGLIVAAPAALLAEVEAAPKWYADFDEAAKVAKATGKDLLIDFTGSDWCHWCIKLEKEVFDQKAFADGVKDKWILVALDFPRAQALKDKIPNQKRNEALQKQWFVQGFPTVFLTTADGEVYGRTGYKAGGPEGYVEHLVEMSKTGKDQVAKAGETIKSYETADDDAKAEILTKTMDEFDAEESGSPVAMKLLPVVKRAITLDAKNEAGLKLKSINAIWDKGMADDAVLKAAEEMDPKNEHGFQERLLEAGFRIQASNEEEFTAALKPLIEKIEAFEKAGNEKDKNRCMMLYANAAYCSHKFLKDAGKATHFAKKVKAMGGDKNPRLKRLLDMLLPAEEEVEVAPETPEKE